MSAVLISRGNVFRAVLCGVFAAVTFTATESRAAAPTAGVPTLKTVTVSAADVVFTYEYAGAPVATFSMPLPGIISDPNRISIDGFGWPFSSPEIVPNGDGTFDAQITNSGGATTGKLKATVRADNGVLAPEMKTVYINLGDLAANPASLHSYAKVTNLTRSTIPKGTVLQFRNQTPALVSKLVNDLQAGVGYCLVGMEQRVIIENVDKKELAPWLPVAMGGGTVEFRMAEAWSFKLTNGGVDNVEYEFIDLRKNFAPFPINGQLLAGNELIFESTPGTIENVLRSVSTIPVTASANASAENWADFLQAFTDNAKTLCTARNARQTNDNCGADPYCFCLQWLADPFLKPKSLPIKNAVQNRNDLVAFLKDAESWVNEYTKIKNKRDRIKAQLVLLGQRQQEIEQSRRCLDCLSVVMISEPVNSLKTASSLVDQEMHRFGDSLLNHLHGWNSLVDKPLNTAK